MKKNYWINYLKNNNEENLLNDLKLNNNVEKWFNKFLNNLFEK